MFFPQGVGKPVLTTVRWYELGHRKSTEEVRMDPNQWTKIISREENKVRNFIVARRMSL